ncbi:hypothetical protein K7I13_12050 [Brucepastera parasyntrophica]|uniref:hypothetical protein n=1 Tax=Brucepastera parasyntrophica TaxID=2880008 RepID=UPI00210E413E|nr:hypothetical protein [Brucepastera parasyntrophica]ULQ59219.1 hypothetical protein K7I13_12050 [Brucepastera parasyntrophica]
MAREIKTLGDFIRLVVEMRAAQKLYFRTHSPSDLQKAKNLEKEVDGAIADREEREAAKKQGSLF